MKKQINPKMELLTELQYRYDQLKAFNVGKIERSDGKILDFDLTKVLKMYEELMLLLVEDVKPKVLEIDLNDIPEGADLNGFINEFKNTTKEWDQPHLNLFLNSKFGINNTEL